MARDRAGVGYCDEHDSIEAGRRAGRQAVERAGGGEPGLVLAFGGGAHDPRLVYEGIRSEVGQAPIVGGSTIGVITNQQLGYRGFEVGAAALPADLVYHMAAAGGLDRGGVEAGLELGRALAPRRNPEERAALLFYESVASPPPPAPVLNASSHLLDGFAQGLGKSPPAILGAGLMGGFDFSVGRQFCGHEVGEQCAAAVLLCGDCRVHSRIMHGCEPISTYHTITRVEGAVVYEIDERPALDVIDELMGDQPWRGQLPVLLLTLGVNHGDRFGPYDEESYVSRLIAGLIPEERAIVLFEADFEKGSQFQFMRRSHELMEESAERGCAEALAEVRGAGLEPFLALYVDCAGRTASFAGVEREEAEIVQRHVGDDIPLLGFYSGVEIAPLLGKSRGLDWTGVLILLSREGDNV